MEIEKKIEWLKPERIEKLYTRNKSVFGINRLMVIGIGKNGLDCVLNCKHIIEKRFGSDDKKVRFLGIAEESMFGGLSFEGTTLTEDECFRIVPDESIYRYLNNPARLPQYALSWFDNGLRNYSPAAPTYGLTKRQCGRVALFHNIKQFIKRTGESISAFGGSDKSLEIVLTGNMGDAFFSGMFIDIAYILRSLYESASYPVKISCMMFAADTAELFEQDARELGNYYANTAITKDELDLFQLHRKPFAQRYSATFEVQSDKPPFNAVLIPVGEKSYRYTLSKASEKIVSRMEMLFTKDDDAERIMSYNMLRQNESHDFRYLGFDTAVREIPLGKMLSYLSVKTFTVLNHRLNANNVGENALGRYAATVTPDADYLASKGGDVYEIEFDEKINPVFSIKSLKVSSDNSQRYINEWLDKFCAAVKKGADISLEELIGGVISDCEKAKTDIEKGPFYSIEIVKKCMASLRVAIAKANAELDDMNEQVERSKNLVNNAYMKLKTSALFAGKAAEQYIEELRDFVGYSKRQRTAAPLIEYYQQSYDKLQSYLDTTLQKAAEAFENIAMNRQKIIDEISAENSDSVSQDVFSLQDKRVSEKLDALVDNISEPILSKALVESGILELPEDDEAALARAMVSIVAKCFEPVLLLNYADMCEFFGYEGLVADSIGKCADNVSVDAETTDAFALNRIICPKATKQDDIASLRAEKKGMSYIWNGSVLNLATVCTQIKGGIKLSSFNGYEKWENMRYAYVNDSLKKHGIRIFR
ncbi:MAG: hypothetical protein KIG62_08860 [Oscillospiraceae bacterium]|nr:hypothetical protein [Oscillospiraceae bacterium]